MKYRITCRTCRQPGAIGIAYPVSEIIDAGTQDEAEAIFNEKWERCWGPPLVITEEREEEGDTPA